MIDAILTINAGSTSLKFAAFQRNEHLTALARGELSQIGMDARWRLSGQEGAPVSAQSLQDAIKHVCAWAEGQTHTWRYTRIVHRIVHGGAKSVHPIRLDDEALRALDAFTYMAPLHQGANLGAAQLMMQAFPNAVHLSCFDTAFHAAMPRLEQSFALPRIWFDRGVRRYGFHGLSYEWIVHRLAKERPDLGGARIVAAHLGGGASLCAIRHGRSIATTMGMTAIDGVPMSTRSGAIDPGAVLHLAQPSVLGLKGAEDLLSKNAGLKGLSGISGDVRDLRASRDQEASFALDYFASRVAQAAAALTVPLGGIDALVFSGGIGANDALMRDDIVKRLAHLGAFETLAMQADEEWIMAQHALNWT